MLLRAMGLTAGLEAPLNTQTITITLPPSSFFSFSGSTVGDFKIVAFTGNPIGMWACLIASIGSAFTGNAFSVPMSNAANQAEVLLQQNLYNWQSLAPRYQTTANRAIFAANFTTVWNAYVTGVQCDRRAEPDRQRRREGAASHSHRATGERGGKFDWFAYATLDPIASSATPGDSMAYPSCPRSSLSTFVLSSLIVGDGSGAAEIAAAQVPAILGTGNETSSSFRESISSQKPFRDWLTEVLNCCLGFYTWEFGKLKLGCRINASAVDAYTIGNILFQSLRLTPIQAAFEHLVLSYADVAYQYQTNTAEYCDKSHAAYYGRAGSPLTSQMHSVGISTLSQALRIAATRTREECGGVTPMEWRNARTASWQTTLLGLGNEVGQVVSMTHPDIPGARGTCNVTGATATWVSGDVWTYAGTATGDTELDQQSNPDRRRPGDDHGGGERRFHHHHQPGAAKRDRPGVPRHHDVLPGSAVEPQERLVGAARRADRYRVDVRPGRRAEAGGRGARAAVADLLRDPGSGRRGLRTKYRPSPATRSSLASGPSTRIRSTCPWRMAAAQASLIDHRESSR